MSRFDRLMASKGSERFEGSEIDGVFACQQCDEVVDKAIYNVLKGKLMWRCPNDHISMMDDVHF